MLKFLINNQKTPLLHSMEPTKNYKLFLKATQLDVVQETLNQCLQQHNYLKYRLECQRDEYDRYLKDKSDLEKKYNELLSLKDLKSKLEDLKKEQFWVDVIEQESILKDIAKQLSDYQEQANKLSQLIDTRVIQRELKDTIKNLEASMAEHTNDYRAQNSALNEFKNILNQESESYHDERSDVEKLKEREARIAKDVEQCEQYIQEKNEV